MSWQSCASVMECWGGGSGTKAPPAPAEVKQETIKTQYSWCDEYLIPHLKYKKGQMQPYLQQVRLQVHTGRTLQHERKVELGQQEEDRDLAWGQIYLEIKMAQELDMGSRVDKADEYQTQQSKRGQGKGLVEQEG